MSSAPSPATRIRPVGFSGSTAPLFFSSTIDSRTASRAMARWAADPSRVWSPACGLREGGGSSNTPARSFTRSTRRTASSSRLIGITPERTSATILAYSSFQSSGTLKTSIPALKAAGQSALVQPGAWPWAFQSPITRPSKPKRSFSTPVSRLRLTCIFTPRQLENEAMTACTPASTAAE